MGDVKLSLFNDITHRKLVLGPKNQTPFSLPSFYQEDKVYISAKFLEVNPAGTPWDPYLAVNVGAVSMTIKIGNLADGTILASQSSWTADTGQNLLKGALNLNTPEMVTAMTGQTEITRTFEIEFGDADGKMTTLQQTVKIKKELITAGSPTAQPIADYMTRDELLATFSRFFGNPAGATITLKSPDGSKQLILGVRDDGSKQEDVI